MQHVSTQEASIQSGIQIIIFPWSLETLLDYLSMESRLVLKLKSSCLSFPSADTIAMYLHTWLPESA